jgi:asparagine N-glycosylation enzyme membrane subunit Stt3
LPVNLLVTFLVIALGVVALISGLRKKFPKHLRFIGHTRFANYFMIMIFPIQAHYLAWTWERLFVIVLFAVPIWLLLHFGLMPVRR